MTFWLTIQKKSEIAAKAVLLTFAVILASLVIAKPVFAYAKDVPNNIIVYDNKEKTLKITEISFTHDFTSMSVLVENIQTKADFRIEHELNTGDTFNEYIEITATDGMGNVSETVNIKNPFYLPEITESIEEPEPIKGSLSVTGGSGNGSKSESDSETVFKGDETTSEKGGFNTNGWATVVDNAESGSKEFFIVRSETGNEFYIVIDRESGKDNIYFLNAVTEWDLLGLTKKYEVPNNLNPNSDMNGMEGMTSNDTVSQEMQKSNDNQTEQSPGEQAGTTTTELPKQGGIGIFGIILLIFFTGAVGAYFYLFKFKRKTNNTNNADFLPDDYGEDDYEDEEDTGNGAEIPDEDDEEDTDENDNVQNEYDNTESPTVAEQSSKVISEPTHETPENTDNHKKDLGDIEDDVDFTDDDVGDGDYGEYDDYEGEVDERDVLGGLGGDEYEEDDEEEDNTV